MRRRALGRRPASSWSAATTASRSSSTGGWSGSSRGSACWTRSPGRELVARALARVDLAAIQANTERMRRELRDGTALCAVVKADGYGHGAVPAARAALAGGATWLAVAAAHEARDLRDAGMGEVPILVLGALSPEELDVALGARADVTAWT